MFRFASASVLLLFAAAFVLAQPAPTAATAPVDAYLTAIAEKLWTARAAEVAAIRTPAEVRARQTYIRERILAALGGWPGKTPLNARMTGALTRQGYRVEKLVYESLPRFHVTANVYVPDGKGPFPAVVGVAGHSANGKASATYQHAWIGLVRRGYLVLAYDPPGQGERSEYFHPDAGRSLAGIGTGEHMMAGQQCLLTGSNFARYEIWDGIRAVDYLLTRGDVDPQRIAVAGNSGGGTQTAYLQALEPRLAAAAPSCYITSWRTLWAKPGPQDSEQVFDRFLADKLDFGDFLIAFAPKPMKMMTAIRDFFPIEGARETYAEARRIWEVLDAGPRAGFFEFDDPHGWSQPRREATYQWFDKWLLGKETDGKEPPIETEDDRDIEVTPTGQVSTSFGGETVQSLNAQTARALHARRTALSTGGREGLAKLIGARLRLSGERRAPTVTERSPSQVVLETEPGIRVPVLVAAPAATGERKPAVIYLNPIGRMADSRPGGGIEALTRNGYLVLAPDLRAAGDGPHPRGATGYTAHYQTAMRALLVGKTILGMQVEDALAVFDYLVSRPDADPRRVSIIGKGIGGVVALHAAALEPRLRKVAVEGTILSYLAFAEAKLYEGLVDIVVPGILKDYDLPDLAAAIAPRPVLLVEPRSPAGARLNLVDARKIYGQNATPAPRAEGWTWEKTYASWLQLR